MMGWIRIKCRHYNQCGNEAKWLNTDIKAYYCDLCKQHEIAAELEANSQKDLTVLDDD